VGKITRINAVVGGAAFRSKYPRKDPAAEFLIIDGYIDILLPSIASGAAGVSVAPPPPSTTPQNIIADGRFRPFLGCQTLSL
jgi:hypothetical protein